MAIARGIAGMTALLAALSFGLFMAVEVLPGDPASQALAQGGDPERVAALRAELGLDRPYGERYLDWIGGLLTGDWGASAVTGVPVGPVLAEHAGRSLVLSAAALLVVLCFALPAGVIAGSRPGSVRDRATSLGSLVMLSVPEFVLAAVLVAVFADWLGWFPPVSLASAAGPLAEPEKLVLPTVTLAAVAGAFVLRLTRAAVAEASGAAHVEAARLAGFSEFRVITRHLLPSVRAPLSQAVALAVPYMAGGTLVVETVFGYPGLAELLAEAVGRRDAVVVSGAGLIIAATAVCGFGVADLLARSSDDRLAPAGMRGGR